MLPKLAAAPEANVTRRRAAWLFVLASYALLSAVPFAPWLAGRSVTDVGTLIGLEAAAWLLVWGIFRRPGHFHWLLLPAFLLLPADAYLYRFYGRGVSPFHLSMVADTNPDELLEFLGSRLWVMLAVTLMAFTWWLLVRRAALRTDVLDWNGRSRKWSLIGMALLGSALAVEQPLASPSQLALEETEFADTRPFGFLATAVQFVIDQHRLSSLGEDTRGFRFGAHPLHAGPQPLVMVVVIGESSRFDRWSLNGYRRETNPLLAQERNLISAPDVVASASATLLSVPAILSRKRALDTYKTGFPEKSFIAAFREAGFRTWWLSNQLPSGKLDTPLSVFAKQAEVVQFLNLGGYHDLSSFDGILEGPLRRALADPAPRKLIVLHTLGNHWNYSHRYPADFDKWQPSLSDIADPDHTDPRLKHLMSNSYDNSVLYADWFLSRVIASVKATGQPSAMVYVSDHGENLHDGTCDYALHGHNSQIDYHIPLLVWYSNTYASSYPQKVQGLRRNLFNHLSTENIFESVVDMGDIGYRGQLLEWSFASARFQPHTRYVDSYGWADYDRATFKGDCREVIDKHPLQRMSGRM